MALSNYSQLQDSMKRWLWGRDDLDGVIPDAISMFEADANSELRVSQMETTATITLTAGTGSLPTDYLAWRRVYANSDPVTALESVDPDWAILSYPSTAATNPKYFYIAGTSIFTKPVCSSTLAMLYFQKIPALASNTSGNWLLTRAPNLYLYGSLMHMAPMMDDDPRALTWKTLRDEGFAKLTASDTTTKYARAVGRIRGATP
jgi:hypothetical protein